ncbi:MAG: tetratricopeptide repeat protein [Bacteroidales bacterium]|nr:tetratricopeptide repeat protein [Bacteroidales bacterium]
MGRNLDRNRRLADYIYKDLSTEEVVEIEKEISGDPQLSDSFLLNMQVKDYLQSKVQLEEMRSDPQLEDAEKLADTAFDIESHDELDQESIPIGPKRNRIRNIAFAAAVAASITIIFAVGIIPSRIDQDRLFDRYYEPVEASDYSQRSEANEMYRDIAIGINNYVAGNYRQSIDQFSKLASDPAIQSEVRFFTALSYLGLGQYQSAQNILESVHDGDNRYQAETLWYLSLCYLKTGDFNEANALLGQLEIYDGLYKEDAQTLRKKLRRFTQ